jgi:hypothetical protein
VWTSEHLHNVEKTLYLQTRHFAVFRNELQIKKYLFLSHLCVNKVSKKSKAVPLHAMEALGGDRRYSSYSFTTSVLDGG